MKTDIEISRETPLKHINDIAKHVGIPVDSLIHYGKHKAKVPYELINESKVRQSNLILVTAITPTKAGIGKTTTSVGLALGLEKIGKRAIVALREPSLGPCFGMKGGAAGGGYAQVLPMEDINLHFTGDFHAITAANNMIAALLDNYIYQNRASGQALKQVLWKRVLDVNDRSLRHIVSGLGGSTNGLPTETGFDITVASEIMAILCLSVSIDDLREKIDNILLGYRHDGSPFIVKDLGIGGSVVALLKDAINPNLVQTTENTAAFIHGGPFANIAHGCNSVMATKMALSHADYVVTEAGFGADLGAEKFFNIKCRKTGLQPKVTVIVVTSQALKLHGGVAVADISKPDLNGLKTGLANLQKHLQNLQNFGQSVVIGFNQYGFDTPEEMDFLREWALQMNAKLAINNSFTKGGQGATELATIVAETIANNPSRPINFTYDLNDPIQVKIEKVATRIYGAKGIKLSQKAISALKNIQKLNLEHLPICIAKTQYSFSDDPKRLGVATDFVINIEELVINKGAGFVVAVAGDIMRMPGLPKDPQALRIDVVNGMIEGLS
ncbi:MAG: formate--tetrahydrofolate ligase [Cytophagales bacterium]|nr:MAG: formate--tetrahydrofolate ligase [Cytophagales bacterium]TAF61631.1 MAG: formate--tetrahydrofolate ligase [Cytophagales bacterium]